MTAAAHTGSTRYAESSKQMLSFQAFAGSDHDRDEQEDRGADEALEQALASILSSDLLRGKKAVSIRHNGSVYRLQATRLGKLILTK